MANIDSYSTRNALNKLIELIQPNNSRIDSIKDADEQAKQTIQKATDENKDYKKRLEDLKNNNSELLALKDAMLPIAKKYVKVIEENNLPIDFANISERCKSIVEAGTEEIEDISSKIKVNSAEIEKAEKVVNETPIRLSEEEQTRLDVKNLLEIALNDDGYELTKSRITATISKLGVFSEDEIHNMLPTIMFPDQGLSAAYNEFEGVGKSTKQMLQEAMGNQNKPIEEGPSVQVSEKKEPNLSKTSIDLDEILSRNAHKVVSTEKKMKVSQKTKGKLEEKKEDDNSKTLKTTPQVKSEEKANPEEAKIEFIKNTFKADDIDLKFYPEVLNMSLNELKSAADKLKNNSINPEFINLRNLSNIDQFIANIDEFADSNMKLDDQTIAKNPYLDITPTERVHNNIQLVGQNGLSLVKRNGKIALSVVTRETNKLLKAINLIGGIDFKYFIQDPENMSKIVGGIAARISYCIQNGIDYVTPSGEFESFIENAAEFNELYGQVDTSIIPSAKECNKALVETVSSPDVIGALNEFYKSGNYLKPVELNQQQMDKFMQISALVQQKAMVSPKYEIVIDNQKFFVGSFQKNLSYLLSLNLEASDDDLILASLFFNAHKPVEAIKDVLRAFDPNTLNLAA